MQIGALVCGHEKCEGIAKVALDQLNASVTKFASKAIQYLQSDFSDETLSFGPFCARALLENSYAALVGRIDTFRILYLSEFQSQPEYEHGRRAKSAFSWAGDVMPEEKATTTLWHMDTDIPKISRALFSQHCNHIYWKPAIDRLLDEISSRDHDPALEEIKTLDSETFINESRGRSAQLYSTLSKGVHWEFFTSALIFDEPTVKNAIREACTLVGRLGFASHFIPTAYASLTPDEAIDAYLTFIRQLP